MSVLKSAIEEVQDTRPLSRLINEGCKEVGGIYRLSYQEALVLTDDYRKNEAGGIPLGAYLLAATGAFREDNGSIFVLDDEELVLLRVQGTAPLPNDSDLTVTRLAVVRDSLDQRRPMEEITDSLTRAELQQSAFSCEVLGTLYVEESEPDKVRFGSDIDNVFASARYEVFLPGDKTLAAIASYSDSGDEEVFKIGTVRFSSTQRRAQASKLDAVPVNVHVEDFVSRKTAVFGMTRTGKSNTIKTLVTQIYKYAHATRQSIGQLIFDPQGEYANVNEQDETGLMLLGDTENVRIYRLGVGARRIDNDSQVFPLEMNFYDLNYLKVATDLVATSVLDQSNAAYLKSFASIDWSEPSDHRKKMHWQRAVLAFYALLYECGYIADHFYLGEKQVRLYFSLKSELVEQLLSEKKVSTLKQGSRKGTFSIGSPSDAKVVFSFMHGKQDWDKSDTESKDTDFSIVSKVFDWTLGKAIIRQMRAFHSSESRIRPEDAIWEDMRKGRISVVDLSLGNDSVSQKISENIVTHLLNRANERFRSGESPTPFQIVVEEAHNLFERGAKEVAGNPWVRLSKEAAKYKIGLVYATQEVTSVDQRILSNTSNWLVAHLNSDKETKELSHYYEFGTWADSLRRCEDVGFIRMKTYSGKYIVPVQVALFDHAMINDARCAAGLGEVLLVRRGDS